MANNKLPQKPLSWVDDPRAGHIIDDNALYLLQSLSRGVLSSSGTDSVFAFTVFCPLEWNHTNMLKFLIRASEEYNFELSNHQTLLYALKDDYEVPIHDKKGTILPEYEKEWEEYSKKNEVFELCRKKYELKPSRGLKECEVPIPPRKYGGAYQWVVERAYRKQDDEDFLFWRILNNKFNTDDLKRIISLSERSLAIGEPKDSNVSLAKNICESFVRWATFETKISKKIMEQMQSDISSYMEKFIAGNLKSSSGVRRVNGIEVLENPNIYKFDKHKDIVLEKFAEMRENYGETFVFENPFDEGLDSESSEVLRERYARRQFLFIHVIFAFQKLGYIKIKSLGNNWHWSVDRPLRYVAKIELQPLFTAMLDKKQHNEKLHFDVNKSRLYVKGSEIKIRKFSDQYHVLRIIFQNLSDIGQEWFFSDIAEQIDSKNLNEKRYYNAIYQVGIKLKTLGFSDFFITTRQSLKIDPKYLS